MELQTLWTPDIAQGAVAIAQIHVQHAHLVVVVTTVALKVVRAVVHRVALPARPVAVVTTSAQAAVAATLVVQAVAVVIMVAQVVEAAIPAVQAIAKGIAKDAEAAVGRVVAIVPAAVVRAQAVLHVQVVPVLVAELVWAAAEPALITVNQDVLAGVQQAVFQAAPVYVIPTVQAYARIIAAGSVLHPVRSAAPRPVLRAVSICLWRHKWRCHHDDERTNTGIKSLYRCAV